MSEERVTTRWWFNPLHPNKDQQWQIKVGDEWVLDESREKLVVTEESLIESWWKVMVLDTWENKRSVSTIAKHYNTTVRHIKTMRAYINTKNENDGKIKVDDEWKTIPVLLPNLPDFTPYEQSRIDRAQADRTPSQLFDAMPPTLRAKALKHLGLA